MVGQTTISSLSLALILLLFHPHSAPTLWLNATIEPGTLELVICVRADHADAWVQGGLPAADLVDFITTEENMLACDALTEYFGRHNKIFIDGVQSKPIAQRVTTPEDADGREMIDFLAFHLLYRFDGDWPRKVQFIWEDFEAANFMGETLIPGTIRIGPQIESMSFSPEEPKFTWIYPETGLPVKEGVAAVPAPTAPGVPWAAHALIALAALGGAIGLGRAGAGVATWALLLLLIGGSAFALPWKPSEKPVITEPQARVVFETLLGNVYRAFEAVTEEDSYDLLALSVEPDLTQKLYLEVQQGLEMRNQGGAIAEVGSVERRGGTIEFTGARAFRVKWRWRVFAHITHWGHTHTRVNEYVANFVVRAGGRGWRIAKYEVLDMQRIPTEEDEK